MDNLSELRDIHLPTEGVSFFPPAYGWWVVLLSLIAGYVLIKLIVWMRKVSARLYAYRLLTPLKEAHNVDAAASMSEILRRICVRKYPQAVAYTGKQWLDFLTSKTKQQLSDETAALLLNAPFLPKDDVSVCTPERAEELWSFCYAWIGDNL